MGTISDTTAKWSSLAMGVFGIGLTLVCMGFLAQTLWQFFSRGKGPRSPGEIVSLLIKAMLPWAPLARALDCLLFDNELIISPVSDQPWSAVFLGTIPGFLYVILYLLLVFFWGWLYLSNKRTAAFRKNVMYLWGIIAGLITTVWLCAVTTMAADPTNLAEIHDVYSVFISVLSLLTGVLFILWSIALIRRLQQSTHPSRRTISIAKKIFFLTLVCSGLFFLRGTCTALNSFWFSKKNMDVALFVSRWLLWFGCDYFSAVFMLLIVFSRTSQKEDTSEHYKVYLHPESVMPSSASPESSRRQSGAHSEVSDLDSMVYSGYGTSTLSKSGEGSRGSVPHWGTSLNSSTLSSSFRKGDLSFTDAFNTSSEEDKPLLMN